MDGTVFSIHSTELVCLAVQFTCYMIHLESMDTVGTLCDPSHAYVKGFERPLQPVKAILAMLYLIFCAKMVTKTRIWLAKWVSFWYDSRVIHM